LGFLRGHTLRRLKLVHLAQTGFRQDAADPP
jgi:hypothetical protein